MSAAAELRARHRAAVAAQASVPAGSALFWATKLVVTGMGEAASDGLARIAPVLPALVGVPLLAVALILQLGARTYRPVRYWATVSAIAVLGTVAADGPRVVLGLPIPVMCALFALAVGVCLGGWWLTERTLDVHAVHGIRRQLWYWATVGATFALGTALGDLLAATFGLGYGPACVVFAVLLAVPAVLFRLRLLGGIAAFWTAYVLTRPLGASVADWLGKPRPLGVDLGDGSVVVGALVLVACGVALAQLRLARPS